MSQRSLPPNHPDIDIILIGWDPGLSTFYARVVPTDSAAQDAPCFWIGTDWGEFYDPRPVIDRVTPHATIPGDLLQALLADSHPSLL